MLLLNGASEPGGWVVMVGILPHVRYFDVAISDRLAAIWAVRTAQQLDHTVSAEASARLSRQFLDEHSLSQGEIRRR